MGTWTQAVVPHQTAKLWTATTIVPLDCGPKKPEPGQHLPQLCPRKLRPVALAEVLMKLTESCVIEQHIDRLLKSVLPTNLWLGTPVAAALSRDRMQMSCYQLIWRNAYGRAFRSTCLEAARGACPQLAAICAAQLGALRHKTVDSTTRGGWQGSRAMQVMFVLGLEFALTKSDAMAPRGLARIGLQDEMTFIGSAAALNRLWNDIENTLAEAGHRLRGYNCGVWAPGFEQFEDLELPTEVRDLCMRVPRKQYGGSLHHSAANMRCCMHAGLGQPAEPPTQTIERVDKALATLQNIERFACDQHDHVSFAKAWMLTSKGVAHALDYDFRLIPPAVMAPLQRRLEGGLAQTLSVLLGSAVSELAWERAKLPTCFGALGGCPGGLRGAGSAVDLHKAVMTSICEALGRPLRRAHPEETTALAAKADLLMAVVAG